MTAAKALDLTFLLIMFIAAFAVGVNIQHRARAVCHGAPHGTFSPVSAAHASPR